MFQVTGFIPGYFLLSILVASSSDEDASIDYQTTEILKSLLETRNFRLVWPHIGTQVLWEVVKGELFCRFGAGESGVDIKSTVRIE
jgi:hypothetical protein